MPFHSAKAVQKSLFNNRIFQAQNLEPWTSLIPTLAHGGSSDTELALCKSFQMLNSGNKPDGHALVHLVRASTDLGFDSYCQQLHAQILQSGFGSDASVSAALVRFYTRIEASADAYKVFVEIPQPKVVAWNTLISGYVQSGQCRKALELFLQLERSEICADAYSVTAALAACGQLGLVLLGRCVHSKIVKYGLELGVVVGNCLIDMYGKCGYVEEAIRVFNEMIHKDVISWNSVISASARNQKLELAYSFLCQMPEPDTISYNELINGIAQFGNIDDAIQVLSRMPKANSSSWNSIITGCVNRNRARQGLDLFSEMHSKGIKMDEFTFSIILSGIAGIAALTWGMLIHCCTTKFGLDTRLVVGSALIDMYSKCGQLMGAESMFESLPNKNLVTWNAMISGCAHNGNSTKVIQLFEQLKTVRGLKPDGVTFLNVLAACANSEMPLQTVIQYFEMMINEYGIEPTVEHCCSMIRVMVQRGEVWRAERMILELGFGSCGVVWKALLGACGACRDLEVAKIAAAKVIELEGDNDYVYVMMSNVHADQGNWGDARTVREVMNERGVRKEIGCSWIELENVAL